MTKSVVNNETTRVGIARPDRAGKIQVTVPKRQKSKRAAIQVEWGCSVGTGTLKQTNTLFLGATRKPSAIDGLNIANLCLLLQRKFLIRSSNAF